ncbi:MAG: epimerase [Bacteroidetes bacterium]|nr:epimerase [Bacteroidota bacterium]
MKIKAVILGATGMVGEGVMHESLSHPDVESVIVVNRKPCGVQHAKLKEIILKDFFDFSSISDELKGYNAFYYCMGVSSVGLKEAAYKRITYDLTMHIANLMLTINPDMVFTYVSGVGTDSTEKGKSMWARIKGKTENDLLKLPFKDSYMFRPGYIQPTTGLNNAYKAYTLFAPFYPLWKLIFPKYVSTLEEIGLSMINVTKRGFNKKILKCTDIQASAKNLTTG